MAALNFRHLFAGFGLCLYLVVAFSISDARADKTIYSPNSDYEKWAWDVCLCKYGHISKIRFSDRSNKFTCVTTPTIMRSPPKNCQKTLKKRPKKVVAKTAGRPRQAKPQSSKKVARKPDAISSLSDATQDAAVATIGLQKCGKRHFSYPLDDDMQFCERDGYLFGRGAIRETSSIRLELSILSAGSRIDTVYLQSGGGFMSEGIRMGQLIREAKLDTGVTGFCASACLHAYLGGIRRLKTAKAKIGDHRALFSGDLGPKDIGERRNLAQKHLMNYWASMGADPDAVETAWKTSSFGIHWFEEKELKRWKIVTDFAIKKSRPGRQVNTPAGSSGFGFKMTCRHMRDFAKQWNKTSANKWIDSGTRALPIRVKCANGLLTLRAFVKMKRRQVSTASHIKIVRTNVCRNKFIREQMGFGWRFAHQLDFSDKRSRTVDVRCVSDAIAEKSDVTPKAKPKRKGNVARKSVKRTKRVTRRKAVVRKKKAEPLKKKSFFLSRRKGQPASDDGADIHR